MNQVVELLESIQSKDEAAVLETSGRGVTLYEVPRRSPYTPEKGRNQTRSHDHREGEPRRRSKPANVGSRSEPPTESDLISAHVGMLNPMTETHLH